MTLRRKMADFIRRLTIREPDNWVPPMERGDAGEPVNGESALSLSAVWGCVNLLVGTQASLPGMIYRTAADGSRAADKTHPLYRVLHDSPNYDQTAMDFWEFMTASLELRGNALARVERAGGRVVGLHPVAWDAVGVRRLATGEIEYAWTEGAKAHIAKDNQVLHVRGFGGSPLGGLSTLQFARHAFSLARATDKAAAKTFTNGLRPSGTLTFKDWLSPENRKIAETQLATKFMGAANAGRPMILEGGTEWRQLDITPEDAQMLESRAFSVEEICRFFGVPPFMIGHTEKTTSWGAGLEQQILAFQKFALRRRLKRIEQAVEKQLLTPEDRAAGVIFEFNLEGLLRGDSAARSAFYQSALSNGWMTINEVRAKENLSPVDGGDTPRMQMQNVPITQSGSVALPAPGSEAA